MADRLADQKGEYGPTLRHSQQLLLAPLLRVVGPFASLRRDHLLRAGIPFSIHAPEVVAESVAFEAGKQIGLDNGRVSASYPSRYPTSLRAEVYEFAEGLIQVWANELAKAANGV